MAVPTATASTHTPESEDGFGTYTRLDNDENHYADQRYYNAKNGRFHQPDPYQASGGPTDPASWNRYAYVQGDPVNFNDPSGNVRCSVYGWQSSSAGVFAMAHCWSNSGQMLGETHYAVKKMGDQEEEYRVVAQANADYKDVEANDWGLVPAALSRAIQALTLNEECFKLFGTERTRQGRWNPVTVLTSLFATRDGQYGSVDFEYSGVATARTAPAGSLAVGIIGAILGATRTTTSIHRNFWNHGDAEINAHTMLHELGHVYNFSRGSGNFALGNTIERPPSLGGDPEAFDKLITEKCGLRGS